MDPWLHVLIWVWIAGAGVLGLMLGSPIVAAFALKVRGHYRSDARFIAATVLMAFMWPVIVGSTLLVKAVRS